MPTTASFFDDQSQTGVETIWTSISNVEVSDNAYAQVHFPEAPSNVSRILHVSNFLTFDVPSSYYLRGIEINIEWLRVNDDATANIIRLEQNQLAIAGSDNKASPSVAIPDLETTDTFGSPTDLWGTGFKTIGDLAPAGGTVSDFGFGLRVTDGDLLADVRVDAIECVITWTPTRSGAKLIRDYYRPRSKRRRGGHPAGF